MAADCSGEDHPIEIDEQLTAFDTSVCDVKAMLEKLISMPRNDQLQKVDWRHTEPQQMCLDFLREIGRGCCLLTGATKRSLVSSRETSLVCGRGGWFGKQRE